MVAQPAAGRVARLDRVRLASCRARTGDLATRALAGSIPCVTHGVWCLTPVARKRKVLHATSSAQKPSVVTMVTIHRRRPRGYWVRVWRRVGNCSLPKEIHELRSLKKSRAMVPEGMERSERTPEDAEDLVEVWA